LKQFVSNALKHEFRNRSRQDAKLASNKTTCLDGTDGTAFLATGNNTARLQHSNNKTTEPRDTESPDNHGVFMEELRTVTTNISSNRKEYRQHCKEGLLLMFEQQFSIEKKHDSKDEFDPNNEVVSKFVEFILDQIDGISKKLNGKEKQIRFNTDMIECSYALYARSRAGFKEMKSLFPFLMPSDRTLDRVKHSNKVRDGDDVAVFQQRLMSKGAREEDGVLQCDEMKLKQRVIFNSHTGEAVGIADDKLDFASKLSRIFSDKGDEAKPAIAVNQWRYDGIGPNATSWNCGFFYNDGSLTAETMENQFLIILYGCESINSRVHGCVMDQGGPNGKFYLRLRGDKQLDGMKFWLDDGDCYVPHPWDPSRRIYLIACNVHGLKANRNQLYASRPGGSKEFRDEYGTRFGWASIEKWTAMVEHEKASGFAPTACLNPKIAYLDSYNKMNRKIETTRS
jgi:hypothetical protein